MNNKLRNLLLCLVLAAALSLICVLFLHYRSLGSQLLDLQAQVQTSMNAWKTTDAEKQVLMEERDKLKNSLKEAKLSLSEAQDRTREFEEDIEALKTEIQDLESKLSRTD